MSSYLMNPPIVIGSSQPAGLFRVRTFVSHLTRRRLQTDSCQAWANRSGEPVAWRGPSVMITGEELWQAAPYSVREPF